MRLGMPDLWQYFAVNNTFRYVAGSLGINTGAQYNCGSDGKQCYPQSRSAGASWQTVDSDDIGLLWLYGGDSKQKLREIEHRSLQFMNGWMNNATVHSLNSS
jgi:hypothetical protein